MNCRYNVLRSNGNSFANNILGYNPIFLTKQRLSDYYSTVTIFQTNKYINS